MPPLYAHRKARASLRRWLSDERGSFRPEPNRHSASRVRIAGPARLAPLVASRLTRIPPESVSRPPNRAAPAPANLRLRHVRHRQTRALGLPIHFGNMRCFVPTRFGHSPSIHSYHPLLLSTIYTDGHASPCAQEIDLPGKTKGWGGPQRLRAGAGGLCQTALWRPRRHHWLAQTSTRSTP